MRTLPEHAAGTSPAPGVAPGGRRRVRSIDGCGSTRWVMSIGSATSGKHAASSSLGRNARGWVARSASSTGGPSCVVASTHRARMPGRRSSRVSWPLRLRARGSVEAARAAATAPSARVDDTSRSSIRHEQEVTSCCSDGSPPSRTAAAVTEKPTGSAVVSRPGRSIDGGTVSDGAPGRRRAARPRTRSPSAGRARSGGGAGARSPRCRRRPGPPGADARSQIRAASRWLVQRTLPVLRVAQADGGAAHATPTATGPAGQPARTGHHVPAG